MKLVACILCMILGGIIATSLFCGCTNVREGMFEGIKWKMNSVTDRLKKEHDKYPALPLPLPPGKLDMLQENTASPYCHSPFSRGEGQLCVSTQQIDYINRRGGNRAAMTGSSSLYGSDF